MRLWPWSSDLFKSFWESVEADLEAVIEPPEPIELRIEECGLINAGYVEKDPGVWAERFYRHQSIPANYLGKFPSVVVCRELIDFLYREATSPIGTDTIGGRRISRPYPWADFLGAVRFSVYHEVGHALIDLWQLPVTGREEDVADQFAVLMLLHSDPLEVTHSLSLFELLPKRSENRFADWRAYADVHSLSEQRGTNVKCWVYGSDPEAGLVYVVPFLLPGFLSPERAETCPSEYELMRSAWQTILQDRPVKLP